MSALPNQLPGLVERFGLSREDLDRAAWTVDASGRKQSGAAAVNAALAELGGVWRLLAVGGRLPLLSGLEELTYRWVAANRGRLSQVWGAVPECDRPGVRCI